MNVAGGWLAGRVPMGRLFALAMLVLAAALAVLSQAASVPAALVYAALVGGSGGLVTVAFFACWGKAFGRANLGRIQGAAQLLTVLASSAGPLVLAQAAAWSGGSYAPVLLALAGASAVVAVACAAVRVPSYAGRPAALRSRARRFAPHRARRVSRSARPACRLRDPRARRRR